MRRFPSDQQSAIFHLNKNPQVSIWTTIWFTSHQQSAGLHLDNNPVSVQPGVTKRCRLSWLTNSTLVYEPKCGGRGGVAGSQPMSTAVHRCPNKLWRSDSIFNPCEQQSTISIYLHDIFRSFYLYPQFLSTQQSTDFHLKQKPSGFHLG